MRINADGIHYRQLNEQIHAALAGGTKDVTLDNVRGQRYLGTGLDNGVCLTINGVPGNDLGAFMNGAQVIVNGNAQDGVGNTMNDGKIVIRGDAGDILGYSQRDGKIFVRGSVGYRAGIHMKEYQDKKLALVIGGTAQDFLGEYMAGGILILLGLNLAEGEHHQAKFIGTGMHGGVIYLRGSVEDYQLGKEVGTAQLDEQDCLILKQLVGEFAGHFSYHAAEILKQRFIKLYPRWLRPYGRLYAY